MAVGTSSNSIVTAVCSSLWTGGGHSTGAVSWEGSSSDKELEHKQHKYLFVAFWKFGSFL